MLPPPRTSAADCSITVSIGQVSNLVAGGNAGFAGQNGGFIAGLGDAGLGLGGGNIAPTAGISGGSPQLGTAGISGAIPATLNSAGAVIKPSGAVSTLLIGMFMVL